MISTDPERAPRLYAPMKGNIYQVGRITLAFKQTHADYSITESIEPPGAGASLHRHPTFIETFIVCEGRYEFEVAGERFTMGPGETLAIPRGAPHALKSLGPEIGRLLDISSPANVFEPFIKEVSEAMASGSADFRAIALRHGIEFL